METNNIDKITLLRYLHGTLDSDSSHELEKRALEDPFLSDALDGYKYSTSAENDLSLLQRQLQHRVAQKVEDKNTFYFTWQRLSVAACASVIIVLAAILFWMKVYPPQRPATSTPHARVDVSLSFDAPADNSRNDLPADQRMIAAGARPAIGHTLYEDYLKRGMEQLQVNQAGKVIVGFTVEPDGRMIGFRIVKGTGESIDQQVIRLIKEGPAWRGAATPTSAYVQLTFR